MRTLETALIVALIVIVAGCFGRTKVPYSIEHFTLDYPSPTLSGLSPVNESIRIERFGVARSFDRTAMIYKPLPYRLDAYAYSRWRVGPGDMVSDFLLRDMRRTSLFKGVFSYYNNERARFVLDGTVEEFFESDEGATANAVFAVNATVIDKGGKGLENQILFQKTYRLITPLRERSPEGFTQGISADMALFSEQLMKDLKAALDGRGP